jgi:O-acetyl-ADP-ribose deacetylase (regulator of RNase III)
MPGSWLEVEPGHVLELAQGDITRASAEAIVNAANEALQPGGGVDGAIHRVGGPAIVADLEARYGRRRHCPTGDSVVTVGGLLAATWVIHAVGPVWRGGAHGEPKLLASAYRSAMGHAAILGCRSIAFPAISSGVYGYPIDAGAKVALATVGDSLREATSVTRATFVLYSFDAFDVFREAIERLRAGASAAAS